MAAAAMEFRLLGPFEVRADGAALSLGGPKPRTLLAALAAHPDRSIPLDRLVDTIWGDVPPTRAQHALSVYVSSLRAALGAPLLERTSDGYRLRLDGARTDAARFEALLERGRDALVAQRPGRAADALREALSLWRGEALSDVGDSDVLRREAGRLEQLRLEALALRFDADLALGRAAELVPELEALHAEHELDERFCTQLMLALYRSGRHVEALETYRSVSSRLADLGLRPQPALNELQRQILRHDPSLELRSGRGGSLPAQVTSFVGRRTEVQQLSELLDGGDCRLVTLTGPGGVGKTRLALAVAAAAADDFTGGAWFVDLSAVDDPAFVPRTVETALGATHDAAAHIGDRRLLLVLDTLERLVEAGDWIADLLRQCPNLHVLATSRERLHLSGEHLFDVPPLGLHDAVELLVARASVLRRSVATDDATAICERLDGLPLAIELAAGAAGDPDRRRSLHDLDQRLDALGEGPRDAPARQRTLRATLEWSHELLTQTQQVAFARLGVFAGGFTAEAAAAICDVDERPLGELVAKHLVAVTDDRLRLLDTTREYAVARLAAGDEETTTRRRHAEWFADLADRAFPELREGDQRRWLARLETEQANLRAALDFADAGGLRDLELRLAASSGPFWYMQSAATEGRARLAHALDHPDGDPRLRTWARLYWAVIALDAGDLAEANQLLDEVERDRRLLDPDQEGYFLQLQASRLQASDDVNGAIRCHEQTLELGRAIDSAWLVRVASNNLGYARMVEGRYDEAERLFTEVVTIDPDRDRWLTAVARTNLAYLAAERCDAAPARASLLEALEIVSDLGLRNVTFGVYALAIAAWISLASEDRETAARLLAAAEELERTSVATDTFVEDFRRRLVDSARQTGWWSSDDARPLDLDTALGWARDRLEAQVEDGARVTPLGRRAALAARVAAR